MNYKIIIVALIGILIIGVVILFFLARGAEKYISGSGNGTDTTPINTSSQYSELEGQAKNIKAEADIRSASSNLESYRSIFEGYPNTSSFSVMMAELLDKQMIEKELTVPSADYKYLYCSENGFEYNLKAEFKGTIITQKGNSICTPGE